MEEAGRNPGSVFLSPFWVRQDAAGMTHLETVGAASQASRPAPKPTGDSHEREGGAERRMGPAGVGPTAALKKKPPVRGGLLRPHSFGIPGEKRRASSVLMATRMGLEPTISALTGLHVNRYTTGPGKKARHTMSLAF